VVICFFLICLTWHRYIISNQLHRWWIKPVDAIIPFSFAIFQTALIYAIPLDDSYFTGVFCVLALNGWWAYRNVLDRHSEAGVRKSFNSEFAHVNHSHGDRLYKELENYANQGEKHMFWLAVVFFLLTCVLVSWKEMLLPWSADLMLVIFWLVLMQLLCYDFYGEIKRSCRLHPLIRFIPDSRARDSINPHASSRLRK